MGAWARSGRQRAAWLQREAGAGDRGSVRSIGPGRRKARPGPGRTRRGAYSKPCHIRQTRSNHHHHHHHQPLRSVRHRPHLATRHPFEYKTPSQLSTRVDCPDRVRHSSRALPSTRLRRVAGPTPTRAVKDERISRHHTTLAIRIKAGPEVVVLAFGPRDLGVELVCGRLPPSDRTRESVIHNQPTSASASAYNPNTNVPYSPDILISCSACQRFLPAPSSKL